MAKFRGWQIAVALFVTLALAGIPSHASARSGALSLLRASGGGSGWDISRVVCSLFNACQVPSVVAHRPGKSLGSGTPPALPPAGATSETGNTLDPNGVK
jgi:hypothetical protein